MSRSTPGSSRASAPGAVHGPDGQPLAGAVVIVSTKSLRAQLYNGKFHEGAYPQDRTGADCRFKLPDPSLVLSV
jgi:hypothetical protein